MWIFDGGCVICERASYEIWIDDVARDPALWLSHLATKRWVAEGGIDKTIDMIERCCEMRGRKLPWDWGICIDEARDDVEQIAARFDKRGAHPKVGRGASSLARHTGDVLVRSAERALAVEGRGRKAQGGGR